MNLNKDRTLYDLCRRYKYYYKAVKELKEVDMKYYNLGNYAIRKAYKDAEEKLDDTAKRIIMLVLSQFFNPHNTSLSYECYNFPIYDWSRTIQATGHGSPDYKVEVNDKEFFEYCENLLRLWGKD